MATVVTMPRQGQSVESCIITAWKNKVGETVTEGEILLEIETDKAVMTVDSPASGILLDRFFDEGADVPVLTTIAVIGEAGEQVDHLRPKPVGTPSPSQTRPQSSDDPVSDRDKPIDPTSFISPRARKLADRKGVSLTALRGSGPNGRIVERDVQAVLQTQPPRSRLAQSMILDEEVIGSTIGTGIGGRILAHDLETASATEPPQVPSEAPSDDGHIIPLRGTRKIIAERMVASLQSTAQLTLNASADVTALLAYRQRLKECDKAWGLHDVTINDLLLMVIARILSDTPALNAHLVDDQIRQYDQVHLGFAVDTPRGLLVPVIRQCETLSLRQLSQESRSLSQACLSGNITPDDLQGGTFTVSNLGHLGVESFTPILNVPQVAILGIGNINLKPVEQEGEVNFISHIGLSLTVDHQAVDGATCCALFASCCKGHRQYRFNFGRVTKCSTCMTFLLSVAAQVGTLLLCKPVDMVRRRY